MEMRPNKYYQLLVVEGPNSILVFELDPLG